MHRVFIGLGSNLGDKKTNLEEAIRQISTTCKILKISSFIDTEPVGLNDQPNFLNAVIKIETDLEPEQLLDFLQSIEIKMGSTIKKKGPRIIDLDILLFDDVKLNTERLTIPHPRMHERDFVMKLLRDIAPEL